MQKYTHITAVHGNEPIPVLSLASVGIKQLVANPPALKRNQRFVDRDLNSRFGKYDTSYESLRAAQLLTLIPPDRSVIDFHTFTADSLPFVIIVDLKLLSLAKKTGIRHIVYMKHNIKNGHSLIDYRHGISVEVGKHDAQDSFTTTLKVIKNVYLNKNTDVRIFEVNDIITEPGHYQNFTPHPRGFIPILAGENAYDHFGLKAQEITATIGE